MQASLPKHQVSDTGFRDFILPVKEMRSWDKSNQNTLKFPIPYAGFQVVDLSKHQVSDTGFWDFVLPVKEMKSWDKSNQKHSPPIRCNATFGP